MKATQTLIFLIGLMGLMLLMPQARATSDIHSGFVNDRKLSTSEVAAMDPMCRLILVDKPFAHGYNQQKENADLLSRPEYEMAKNAEYVHHRCWAMVAKQRYFSARDKNDKAANKASFYGDMGYVLQNAPKDWKFLPQIHTEIGQMAVYEQDYRKALLSANNALNQSKTYVDAYVLLADAYLGLDSKDKARQAIKDGLALAPTSRSLIRRAKDLGVPLPPPPAKPAEAAPVASPYPAPTSEPAKATPAAPPVTDPVPVPVPVPITQPAPPAPPAPVPPAGQEAPAPTPTLGDKPATVLAPPPAPTEAAEPVKKPNPYCRFCP